VIIINAFALLACLYIIFGSLCALNRMDKTTDYKVRVAYLALVAGAGSQLVWALDLGHFPSRVSGALFTVAVALFMWLNRRRPA
jgi:hypothetical protein